LNKQLIKEFDYDKVGPVAKAFARSNTRRRLILGPVGSAKSSVSAVELVRRAMAQKVLRDGKRRTKWVVVRNTYRQLEDTTMQTFFHWFPVGAFGEYREKTATYSMKIHDAEFDVLFRALDRPDQIGNLLSLEITGGWINEAREVPWPIIEAVDQRIPRYPGVDDGGPSWFGLWMDTNPFDEDSDLYRIFEVERPQGYEIFKQPPAMLHEIGANGKIVLKGLNPQAENLYNLVGTQEIDGAKRGGDVYYPDMVQGKSDSFIRVFILNQYAFSMDGMPVYPEYKDQLHCSDKFTYIPGLPIYRGWDFGTTPACSFTQRTPTGAWRTFHEMTTDITQPMGIDRFASMVLQESAAKFPKTTEFLDNVDPAGKAMTQGNEVSCVEIMKAKGIYPQGNISNSDSIREEALRRALNMLADGEPMFQIHPDCRRLRKGLMGGYHFRRLRTSFDKYTDKPEKNEFSHIVEALQYTFAEMLGRELRGLGDIYKKPIASNKRKKSLMGL
jgi:hypothetical protein